MTTTEALALVEAERERQNALQRDGTLEWIAANPGCPDLLRLAALIEEAGEVARAVNDSRGLRDELIQVAAVAVAWAEAL